jgi:hypothetical protein
MPVILWIWPGTALTIESLFLVNFGPRAQTSQNSHLLQSEATALIESWKPGGHAMGMAGASSVDFGWRLRARDR